LETNNWKTLSTHGDIDDNTVPAPRRCHGSVQYTDEKSGTISVIISGGYNGDLVFSDVWRLDLNILQWTCLRKCILPRPVYFHSTALTPEGRMYIFGGIVKEHNKVILIIYFLLIIYLILYYIILYYIILYYIIYLLSIFYYIFYFLHSI